MCYKLSLKRNLAKHKLKVPLTHSVVVQDPVVVIAGDPPPAELASSCASPVSVTFASDSVAENQSGVESGIVSQVKSMFASFCRVFGGYV